MTFLRKRRTRLALILGPVLGLFSGAAHAKVFDFKSAGIAPYVRGTYGNSAVQGTPYEASVGRTTTVDKLITANASGEFGLVLSGMHMSFRLGAELLIPRHYADIRGRDTAGNELFLLDSKILALIPMGNLELNLISGSTTRLLTGFGIGIAFVQLDNKFVFTETGKSSLGVVDYTESAAQQVAAMQAYLGFETVLTDNVTITFDGGYRYVPVNSVRSTKNLNTISGTQIENGDLLNMDGGPRKLDLSGAFGGVAFKFYIDL